jgi:hypothetical protein
LLEQAQESLNAMEGVLAEHGEPPFDYNDDIVFHLVERAVHHAEVVALAVIPLGYVEIIKSPLLQVVDDPRAAEDKVMVLPCADVAQLRRVALEYGDDQARRKLFGL